jgi:peroxiredoxin Q/BCP
MAKAIELKLKEGGKAPEFSANASGGGKISLADFKDKNVILYFYPKDDTPGCTKEACAFRDNFSEFKKTRRNCSRCQHRFREVSRQVRGKIQIAVHASGGRGQKDCRGLRRLGREKFHGPEIHGHAPRDVFNWRRRTNQKDLAAGETGRTRRGSFGGFVKVAADVSRLILTEQSELTFAATI